MRIWAGVAGLLAAGAVVVASFGGATAARAAGDEVTIVNASIDGHSLLHSTRDTPIRLEPAGDVPLVLTLRNNTAAPVNVRFLRVATWLLGIPLAKFQGHFSTTLPAHATATIKTPADFFGIDGATVGYVDAQLQVVDDHRATIARRSFSGDLRGSWWSIVTLVFLGLIAFTIACLADIGRSLVRHTLTANRFRRAAFFALIGASGGLCVALGLAIFRISLLKPQSWIPMLLLPAAIGFVVGYFAPERLFATIDKDELVIDLVAAEAVARASGQHVASTTGDRRADALIGRLSGGRSSGAVDVDHTSGEFISLRGSGSNPPVGHVSTEVAPEHPSGPIEHVK